MRSFRVDNIAVRNGIFGRFRSTITLDHCSTHTLRKHSMTVLARRPMSAKWRQNLPRLSTIQFNVKHITLYGAFLNDFLELHNVLVSHFRQIHSAAFGADNYILLLTQKNQHFNHLQIDFLTTAQTNLELQNFMQNCTLKGLGQR